MRARIETRICIFAKACQPGLVKTRLLPLLSPNQAAELAAAFLDDMIHAVSKIDGAEVVLAWTGDRNHLPRLPANVAVWPQGEGDLGDRLERILCRALKDSERSIAVGSDHPGLPARLLKQAILQLVNTDDAVIGPTTDGGYHLLGMRRCDVGLLSNLPWSRQSIRQATASRLTSQGYRVAYTDPWFDVDRPEDLVTLKRAITNGLDAPATERVVKRLRVQLRALDIKEQPLVR